MEQSRPWFEISGLYPSLRLKRQDTPNGRYYQLPDQSWVESVTTVLGRSPSPYIQEWRQRVGEEYADKILSQAGVRGDALHKIIEKYITNQDNYLKGAMPFNVATFKVFQKFLDTIDAKSGAKIHASEMSLYSTRLRAAGTADLVCSIGNDMYIVDFKTSRRTKCKEDITNYFIQASAYADMFSEIYKIEIPNIKIVMVIDDENEPLIFDEQTCNYWKAVDLTFIGNRVYEDFSPDY